jgi:ABC-type antimicrobial peptide transport system permease subunit
MALHGVLLVALAGLAIGVPAALAASKLVKSFPFGMQPDDPPAYTAAAILLCAAALFAFPPARKAPRMDPMTAVWHE